MRACRGELESIFKGVICLKVLALRVISSLIVWSYPNHSNGSEITLEQLRLCNSECLFVVIHRVYVAKHLRYFE